MIDSAKEFQAIPTVYRGVQMRSRAEADMARLLDLLKMPWQYEATSVLLPNGQHYRPDFVLPNSNTFLPPTWVEVRGYSTDASDRQIQEAVRAVADGRIACQQFYVVHGQSFAGPLNSACFHGSRDAFFSAACSIWWELAFCAACRAPRFAMDGSAYGCFCRSCGDHRGPRASVALHKGYVCIDRADEYLEEGPFRVRDIDEQVDFIDLLSPGEEWIRS
jgi:hypothetical protein